MKYENWEAGRRVFYSEFESWVKRYDTRQVLIALAGYSASQAEFEGFQDAWRMIAPWTVSGIARQAIISSTRSGDRPFDERGFHRAVNLFKQVDVTPPKGFELYPFLAGVAHEQFSYQLSAKEDLSRTLAVLLDTPTCDPRQKSEAELDELLGSPIRDLATSTFVLYGIAKASHGIVTREAITNIVHESPELLPSLESLLGTLTRLSATVDEARKDAVSVRQLKGGLQKYGYNPLTRTPFIRLSDDVFAAPQTHFILQSCSLETVYYLGQRFWPATFGSDLGLRIEAYTGRQLRQTGDLEVRSEIKWKGKKSIDWFIFTPSATILIECKSAHTTLDARAGAATGAQDVASKVGPAITQINKTVGEIRNHNPAFVGIPADRPFVGLVVTAEPIYASNSAEVRQLMPSPDVPVFIMSMRDLESFATLAPDLLGSTVLQIASDPYLSTIDAFSAIKEVLGPYRVGEPNKLIDEAFKKHVLPSSWRSPNKR